MNANTWVKTKRLCRKERTMTECKHRWEQVTSTYMNPNRYWYVCARCNGSITTLLKEKTDGN